MKNKSLELLNLNFLWVTPYCILTLYLFRGEPAPQPVFVIVKQCMPMLTTICQHNTNDAEIINSVCALLKQTVSTLKV